MPLNADVARFEFAAGAGVVTLRPVVVPVGHLNAVPDVDGAIRSEALVVSHYAEAYPSLSAMLVARSLNLGAKDIRVGPNVVRIGELQARTDADSRTQTAFYKYAGERAPFVEDEGDLELF